MRVACPLCSATLCEYVTGNLVIRHRGRLIVTAKDGIQILQCWRCGVCFDGERVRELTRNNRSENGEARTEERPTS
jgi:C4-type Zn-finger protein